MSNKKIGSALAVFEANIDKNRARGCQDKSFIGNLVSSSSHNKALATPTKLARRVSDTTSETLMDDSSLEFDGNMRETTSKMKELSMGSSNHASEGATATDPTASKPKTSSILKAPKLAKRQASFDAEETKSVHDDELKNELQNSAHSQFLKVGVKRTPSRGLSRRGSMRSRSSLESCPSRRGLDRRSSHRSIASTDSCDTFGSFMGGSVDTMGSFATCDSAGIQEETKRTKKREEPLQAAPLNAITARMDQKMHLMLMKKSPSEQEDQGDSFDSFASFGDSGNSFNYDDDDVSDIEDDEVP